MAAIPAAGARRLALKMWTGFPTFPMIFVDQQLVGGNSDLEKLLADKKNYLASTLYSGGDMAQPDTCEAPQRGVLPPKLSLPPNTCDCHFHIFDAPSIQVAERSYTAPHAPLSDYKSFKIH